MTIEKVALMASNPSTSSSPDEHALDFLDGDAKRLVKDMLKAVVEHPDIYNNGFSVTRRQGGYEYHLGSNGLPGPFANRQHLQADVKDALVFHGLARDKVNPQWPDSFRSFTDAALDWQRRYGGPEPDEVRKRIGRVLRQQLGGYLREYDVEEVAQQIGIGVEQVRDQTHVLLGAGFVERVLSGDMEFGVLGLTQPMGVLWAEGGFTPIHLVGSHPVSVNIDLRIEVRNIIEQARSANLPEAQLLEFEARLKRVQEELEKPRGQGRFQHVRELMEFAANTKELALLVTDFVAKNADRIQHLADAAGSIIP